jgi:hypothetical protein
LAPNFRSFSPWSAISVAFGTVVKKNIMVKRSTRPSKAAYVIVVGKKREREREANISFKCMLPIT